MSAWVKQIASQVKKHGEKKASWYCVWIEPDGTQRKKSCGQGLSGKRVAERKAERIKAQLLTGTYKRELRTTWAKFFEQYRERVRSGMPIESADVYRRSLEKFEKLVKPKLIAQITTEHIADFVAKRRKDRGRNPKSTISPATINKDLRAIRAALNVAYEWRYIDRVPKFRFEKEPQKLPAYVTPADFSKIYNSCCVAETPSGFPFIPEQWWKGVVTMAFMTGWRIGEILALRWTDVDLDAGTAVTRHADNKGGRTEKVALHPVVVDHMRALRSFDERVFPWDKARRQLYDQFAAIQTKGEIHIDCPDAGDPKHGECTDACHRYGFHDERRAFATLNAEHMTREALQALMRHKAAATTALYINHARQLNPAVANLHVPDVLKAGEGA